MSAHDEGFKASAITDHPIIFSAPMVRALLDGRKTQTRRLAWSYREAVGPDDDVGLLRRPSSWQRVRPGDRLWVREAWRIDGAGASVNAEACRGWRAVEYRADGYKPVAWMERSPIHMPRWASRLTLIVTDVRVQRLQEIGADDAEAESLWRGRARRNLWWHNPTACRLLEPYRSHKDAFADLWDSIHGPGAWDANPEVVALTFTVARRNIDAA